MNGANVSIPDMMLQLSTERGSIKEFSFVARCNGIIGVPISFMDRFNPGQFEIVGATESEGKGFSNGLWDEHSGIAQPVVAGQKKYKRLFVRRRV